MTNCIISGINYLIDIARGKNKYIRFAKFKKFCKKDEIEFYKESKFAPAKFPIEVIIPCIEKDSEMLPFVVKSIRKNVLQPISSINIISPKDSKNIKVFCLENDCNFVDETTVVPFDKNVRGWLYQQLIKMAWSKRCECEYYLIVDADTTINKPTSFIDERGKMLLEYSDEYHKKYFNFLKHLKGFIECKVSFISHHMLIKKTYMQELIARVERICDGEFNSVVIRELKTSDKYDLYEYEMYGNYMLMFHWQDLTVDYWHNLSLKNRNSEFIKKTMEKKKEYKTLSFHSYKCEGN